MARVRGSVFLVALMLAVAPIPAAATGSGEAAVPRGIVALLESRAAAIADGDREALVATLSPGPFAERDLTSFEGARAVPFSEYRLEVSTRYLGDLAGARVRNAHPGREVRAYLVSRWTAIRGVESIPFLDHLFLTFVRPGPDRGDPYEGWRLASDSDFDVVGAHSARALWEEGPVEIRRSPRFGLLGHPDRIGELERLLPLAEEAYDQLLRRWPRPSSGRYMLVVPSTSEELERMLRLTLPVENFVAFAVAGVDRDQGWEPAAVRFYVHLQNFERHSPESQRTTLAHELVHALARPLSGPFIPSWLEEGLAMAASEPEPAAGLAPAPLRLPQEEDFFLGDVADISRNYRRSQAAVEELVEQSGWDAAIALYEHLGAARVVAGTQSYHLRASVEAATAWELEAWEQAWRERLG